MNTLRLSPHKLLGALLAMALLGPAAAELPPLSDQARALLADKKTKAAIKLLEAATAEQRRSNDVAFLRGVAYQQLAVQTSDAAAKADAVRKAEVAYGQAVARTSPFNQPSPQSAAAYNNLASLYTSLGDDAKAQEYYRQAVAVSKPNNFAVLGVGLAGSRIPVDSGRHAYYLLNYARYLESRDIGKAIDMARRASADAPQSAEAREYLGNLLWEHRIDEMLPYARDLTNQGHHRTSSQWAIKCLNTRSRSEEGRAWLVLYARNIMGAVRYGEPPPQWREELAALRDDPEIGKGANELGAAIHLPPANSEAMGWWRDTRTVPVLKTSPRDAMRDLLRALADAQMSKNVRTAERYLTAAIDMGADGPDPEIFLRLVELYANDDAYEELAKLMERYEFELFTEKGRAYQKGNWALVYRMHVALGMTYAHINAWESRDQFRNPFFQLESAQKAAIRFNEQAERAKKPERLTLPPTAVAKLAEGYARTNRPELALTTRLEGAANLQKAGFTRESAQVLDAIPADQLERATLDIRTQVEKLRTVAMQPRD